MKRRPRQHLGRRPSRLATLAPQGDGKKAAPAALMPGLHTPALLRPKAASISRRTFTAVSLASTSTSAHASALAFLDVALELDVVRQAQRQQSALERHLGRRLLAPDAEAALAVEHLAGFQIALGGRHHVGAEAGGRAGRLVAQRAACDRNAEFEPDHVDRPVKRGVFAAFVRQHGVFPEAAAGVFGLALEHHIGAEREMMRHVAFRRDRPRRSLR